MGEAKRKAAASHLLSEHVRKHRPREGMVGVSGSAVLELGREVMDSANRQLDKGVDLNVVIGVMLSCAVDLYRANYGDSQCRQFVDAFVDRRLEYSVEYWGGIKQRSKT